MTWLKTTTSFWQGFFQKQKALVERRRFDVEGYKGKKKICALEPEENMLRAARSSGDFHQTPCDARVNFFHSNGGFEGCRGHLTTLLPLWIRPFEHSRRIQTFASGSGGGTSSQSVTTNVFDPSSTSAHTNS